TRAIGVFERALALDGKNGLAAQLEGEAQFRARRYPAAHRLLSQARRNGASLTQADELMLASSARIPELDPLGERLSARQRRERALEGLAIARTRLARCQSHAPQAPDAAARVADLSRQADAFARLARRVLARDPDRITDLINLVAQ